MQVQLWGPTNAAPIVSEVADLAEEEHKRIVKKVSDECHTPSIRRPGGFQRAGEQSLY